MFLIFGLEAYGILVPWPGIKTAVPALEGKVFLKKTIYLFLFLAVLGLRSRAGFSLDAANGGYSLVVACRLLSETASIVAQHGL